jgi:type II secretory ATPase GspE/PulE/Tfp pilus assembly ATPase PilB-like protein
MSADNADNLSSSARDLVLKGIVDALSTLNPQYAEKVPKSVSDRRAFDWELCSHGVLSEAELVTAYSSAAGIPVKEEEELQAIERYPGIVSEFLESYCCLPFKWDDSAMDILVCDPYCLDIIEYLIKKLYKRDSRFFLYRRSVLERKIQTVYSKDQTAEQDAFSFSADGLTSEEALRSLASEAKVVRFVNEAFSRAIEMGASDIHVEPEEDRYAIRFRVDGYLQEFVSGPLNQYPAIASRIKLIGGLNIAESRLPQDGRTNFQLGRHDVDMRISTIPIMNGESIVLRLLRKDASIFDLANLGMNTVMRADFDKLIELPHGIILVVGPTGSGKSTTLYSVVAKLNKPDIKIITIEDPVEYKFDGISQMQVNPKIGLTFAGGLRNIVRQDPDVILVGEIRDRETADIAINAALTGHLVLSTLHTNDAPGAITRLMDMGIEGFLISSSLVGVLSQRLVRKICPNCKGQGSDYTMTGNKCKHCGGSGYRGRMGIFEFLKIDDEIRSSIAKSSSSAEIAAIARKNGMIPLIEDGREKVAGGLTTEAELLRAASDM